MMKLILSQLSETELRKMLSEELSDVLKTSSEVNTPKEKEIIGVPKTCELTNLARPTIYGLVNRKEIPHFKRGQKLRFRRSELIRWIEDGRVVTSDMAGGNTDDQPLKESKSNNNNSPAQ